MAYEHVTAGKLRWQISLQQRSDTTNARGERVPVWTTVVTAFAEKQPLRGREFLAAGQMQAPVDVRWRMRYRPGVTSVHRVLCEGVAYEIVGEPIDVDGVRRTIEIMSTSGIRDGR